MRMNRCGPNFGKKRLTGHDVTDFVATRHCVERLGLLFQLNLASLE
jgi:hypothetical protein